MNEDVEKRIAEIAHSAHLTRLIHTNGIRPSHCDGCGLRWPCDERDRVDAIDWLITQLRAAQSDAAELNQISDMQHKREIEAIQRWRAEDPEGRALTMPDYGRLLDWLKEQWEIEQATLALLEPVHNRMVEEWQHIVDKNIERRQAILRLDRIQKANLNVCDGCGNCCDETHDSDCYIAKALAE